MYYNEQRLKLLSLSTHWAISIALESKIGSLRNWHTSPRAAVLQSQGIIMVLKGDEMADRVKNSIDLADCYGHRCIPVNVILLVLTKDVERSVCWFIQDKGWDGFND